MSGKPGSDHDRRSYSAVWQYVYRAGCRGAIAGNRERVHAGRRIACAKARAGWIADAEVRCRPYIAAVAARCRHACGLAEDNALHRRRAHKRAARRSGGYVDVTARRLRAAGHVDRVGAGVRVADRKLRAGGVSHAEVSARPGVAAGAARCRDNDRLVDADRRCRNAAGERSHRLRKAERAEAHDHYRKGGNCREYCIFLICLHMICVIYNFVMDTSAVSRRLST